MGVSDNPVDFTQHRWIKRRDLVMIKNIPGLLESVIGHAFHTTSVPAVEILSDYQIATPQSLLEFIDRNIAVHEIHRRFK